ncbi:unnamed protein product [Ectocarpus sp. CCAP 1310/34]|nr:unnamed protein product [Ectocarpus sp. CCAP 1310/34]
MRVAHCKHGPCNSTVALVVRPSSRSNHSTPLVRRPFSFAGVSARRQADDSWVCHRQSCGRSYPRRLVQSVLKLPHECPQGFGRHSLYPQAYSCCYLLEAVYVEKSAVLRGGPGLLCACLDLDKNGGRRRCSNSIVVNRGCL